MRTDRSVAATELNNEAIYSKLGSSECFTAGCRYGAVLYVVQFLVVVL